MDKLVTFVVMVSVFVAIMMVIFSLPSVVGLP
jgi:hypothetical protein